MYSYTVYPPIYVGIFGDRRHLGTGHSMLAGLDSIYLIICILVLMHSILRQKLCIFVMWFEWMLFHIIIGYPSALLTHFPHSHFFPQGSFWRYFRAKRPLRYLSLSCATFRNKNSGWDGSPSKILPVTIPFVCIEVGHNVIIDLCEPKN